MHDCVTNDPLNLQANGVSHSDFRVALLIRKRTDADNIDLVDRAQAGNRMGRVARGRRAFCRISWSVAVPIVDDIEASGRDPAADPGEHKTTIIN